MLAVLLVVFIDYINPPFPSENTGLALVNNEVKFPSDNYANVNFDYDSMNGVIMQRDPTGSISRPFRLTSDSINNLSSAHYAITRQMIDHWEDGRGEFKTYLIVTDLTGNGSYGFGDYFTLNVTPILENQIFVFAYLFTSVDLEISYECSFAIHDGRLYSWYSHEIDWNNWHGN